jgi:segregation and condensation protein A
MSVPPSSQSVVPTQLPLLPLPAPSEGIEILVQLAKQGDIDPWNVDLVKVADTYLAYVETLQWEAGHQFTQNHSAGTEATTNAVPSQQTGVKLLVEESPVVALKAGILSETEQQQLRLTGKTLLYLAILLRMKSDLLAGFDPFAVEADDWLEDASFEELIEYDEDGNPIDALAMSQAVAEKLQLAMKRRYGSLTDVLERRTSTKQPRIRPVTLEDLIAELKKVEQQEVERATHQKIEQVDKRRMRDYAKLSTAQITQLAHDEFQETLVTQVLEALEAHLPHDDDETTTMTLTDLMDLTGLDRVNCFLSLLFLEARLVVVLEQTDFYGDDLSVRWESTVTVEEENGL